MHSYCQALKVGKDASLATEILLNVTCVCVQAKINVCSSAGDCKLRGLLAQFQSPGLP